jgi:DNA repair protein RadC
MLFHRMREHGVRSLDNAELLSVLVCGLMNERQAQLVGQQLYTALDRSLANMRHLNTMDLSGRYGLSERQSWVVVAAMELGRRRGEDLPVRPMVASSVNAVDLLRPKLQDLPHEEFWLLLLDRGNRLIHTARVSTGGMHGTVADPKLIFKLALEYRASCIILAHNHPSGQLRPSEEDIRLTKKLVEGGRFLDIAVQDHVIVCDQGYYSFADQGQM